MAHQVDIILRVGGQTCEADARRSAGEGGTGAGGESVDTIFNTIVRGGGEIPYQVGSDVGQHGGPYTHRCDAVGHAADDQIVEILVGVGIATRVVGSDGYAVGSAGIGIQDRDHFELIASANERDGVDRHEGGGKTGVDVVDSTDDQTVG